MRLLQLLEHNYMRHGHNDQSEIWYLMKGGKLVVEPRADSMHKPDVELDTLATGRVDHHKKTISIRVPKGQNPYEPLPERVIKFTVNKLKAKYPDYSVFFFGQGKPQLIEDQTAITDFQRWFAGSKVVDEHGAPLEVYHFTDSARRFPVFRIGSHFGTSDSSRDLMQRRLGIGHVGGHTMVGYLNIKRPFFMYDDGNAPELSEETLAELVEQHIITPDQAKRLKGRFDTQSILWVIKRLKNAGFDGAVYENIMEDRGTARWIIFSPDQYWGKFNKGPGKLNEAEIPETNYGYWITPKGEVLPVPYESHMAVSHRYFQNHPELEQPRPGYSSTAFALNQGWIRLIADKGFSAQFKGGLVNRRAMQIMIQIAKSEDFGKYYYDDLNRPNDYGYNMNQAQFLAKAMKIMPRMGALK